MNEAVLRVSNIYIYGFGLLAVLSFLWGSFVFYKKSQESHFEDFHILDSVVMSAFWAFIVGRLAFVALNMATFWNHFPRILLLSNYPGIDRWGVILGIALGVFISGKWKTNIELMSGTEVRELRLGLALLRGLFYLFGDWRF
ncbi:MAG: hypothetical protein UW48_C0024G0006 [Microgenomates group bacterium GW2011_GWC1_44_23]|nr:MAG: hypothetical protein UW48_C0024G0006 [Microgenomates group bacterium GW2011_GWC1_44_23]